MIKNTTQESATHSTAGQKAAAKKKAKKRLSPKVKTSIHSLVKSTRSGAETAKLKTIEMMIDAYKKLKNSSEVSKLLSSHYGKGDQQGHSSWDLSHLKEDIEHMGKWIQASEKDALDHCKHLLKYIASLKKTDNSFKPGSKTLSSITSQFNKIEGQIQDFMSALHENIKHSVSANKQSGAKKRASTTAAKKTTAKKIATKKKTVTAKKKTPTKKVAKKSTPTKKVTAKKTPVKKKTVAKKN